MAISGAQLVLLHLARKGGVNIGPVERGLSALAGGKMVVGGLARRSFPGLLSAGIGAALLQRAITGYSPLYRRARVLFDARAPGRLLARPIRFGASTTIARPPAEVYEFWRDVERLGSVVEGVVAVVRLTEDTSRWTAEVAGRRCQWTARIVDEAAGKRISWESLPGSEIEHSGTVEFVDAPAGRGTIVVLEGTWIAPAAAVAAAGTIGRSSPHVRARRTLRRVKQLLEAGEIAVAGSVRASADGRANGHHGRRRRKERSAGEVHAAAVEAEHDAVVETSFESFPASDPPSWTPTSGVRHGGQSEREEEGGPR